MNKIFGKKGQAALEFLTTYGWAFMVILVMIGALAYFGVLNPEKLIPDQCSATSGFTCQDYQITTTAVNFTLVNNLNSDITMTSFNVTRAGTVICNGANIQFPASSADGQKFSVNCTVGAAGVGKTSGKVKLGYSFEYKRSDGDYFHAASGTISATLK